MPDNKTDVGGYIRNFLISSRNILNKYAVSVGPPDASG